MTRPLVTPAERQAARLQDLDKARLTRMGIDAAIRIGVRVQRAALAAWKRGSNPGPAARAALDEALPLLIDGMVAADLTGRRRVALSTPGSLSLRAVTSAYDAAVAAMRKRLDMPLSELDELRLRYNASALEVLKNTGDLIEKKLQDTMVEIVTGGEHVKSGRAMLADAFDAMGITPDNSFTLEGIFRTQTALAYGAGRWQLEQDPAVQEILWGYKYVTVGDDRVRPEHVGFEGVTLPKDDPFWSYAYPPNGFNCVPSGTKIVTERGSVPIESIRVGERVLTHEGRLRPVLQLHRNPGPKEVVAVETDGGSSLRLTGNHRVFTKRGWVEASGLQVGDKVLQASRFAFAEVSCGQVENCLQAKRLSNCCVPFLARVATTLQLHADAQFRQEEVQPVAIGVDTESERHAGGFKDGGQHCLGGAHRDMGVGMERGVGAEGFDLGFRHFPPNFWPACGRRDLEFCGSVGRPLGMQGMGHNEGIAVASLLDSMMGEDAKQGTETHPGLCREHFQGGLAFAVSGKHRFEAAGPSLLNASFRSKSVGFRSLWLLSNHATIVDVIWSAVKEIRTIPYAEPEVFNLTVAEDQSYFADGIAVHNCRCVAIPLYEPAEKSNVPKQVEVDGKMVMPEVDKGFAFNPGQVLGV